MEAKLNLAIVLVLCFAWQVQCAVNCTATGAGRFWDSSDTTCKNYTLCVADGSTYLSYNYVCPSTSLFNPSTSKCTTNYTCSATSTNSTSNSSCTADGYFSDPNSSNCSTYIECVEVDGSYIETTYSCPNSSYFDPNTTLCESNYTCSSTSFTCTSAGRFANSSDTTCKTYYFCVLQSDDTYVQYEYTCPSTSVFSPTSKVCTTSYTCT